MYQFCNQFFYFKMEGRREFLWLRLHLRSALEVSFIERGDEIYVFADYWPKPPPTIIINEDIEMADISIMKNVLATDLTKEQNCISYHSKSYGGTNISNYKSIITPKY